MQSSTQQRVLVVNTAFLGDVALTTPLFGLLDEAGWQVDTLVIPGTAPLLAGSPYLSRIISYDKHANSGLRGLFRLGRSLAGRYDAVLVPHRSARSALLAWLTKSPLRIGYKPPSRPYPPPFSNRQLRPTFSQLRFLFNRRVEFTLGRQESLRICDLAKPMGVSVPDTLPPQKYLFVAEEAEQRIEEKLKGLPRPLVVIFPGSVWQSKRYPEAAFAKVVKRLTDARELGIVFSGSPAEAELCTRLAELFPQSRPLAGLKLEELKALVAAADCVVANDSAPLHLAWLLNRPIVGIYGPTAPLLGFRPPEDAAQRLLCRDDFECQPCRLRPPRNCPLEHHRCMQELPPERVAAAVLEILQDIFE